MTRACVDAAERPWLAVSAGRGPRLFSHAWPESFTRSPAWVPFATLLPGVAAAVAWELWTGTGALTFAAWSLAGASAWTLVEYLMHRFWFHATPRGPGSRVFLYVVHGHHHQYPNDPTRLVATPLQFGSMLLLFFGAWSLATAHWPAALAGTATAYLGYEAIHWQIHHGRAAGPLMRRLRRHHLAHHRAGDGRWGISSPVWDWILRTDRARTDEASPHDEAAPRADR